MCLAQNNHGQRFGACGRWVSLLPRAKKSMDSVVQLAKPIQAWVHGPHPGERLRHLAEGVLHRARAHGPVAGRNATDSVLVGKRSRMGTGSLDTSWRSERTPMLAQNCSQMSQAAEAAVTRLRDWLEWSAAVIALQSLPRTCRDEGSATATSWPEDTRSRNALAGRHRISPTADWRRQP